MLKNWFKILLVVGMFLTPIFAVNYSDAYVNVSGYYRKDGTYVRPHVRSNPNGLKYDNYGYKPSDGLYNKTYGTRGSDWDTPTYITDPDYYEGKALYESGSSEGYNSSVKSSTDSGWCPSPMSGAQRCYLWENSPTKHHTPPISFKRIYKTLHSSTIWELSHWSSFGWGTRKPFSNARSFINRGYSWSNIKTISWSELEKYQWKSSDYSYF